MPASQEERLDQLKQASQPLVVQLGEVFAGKSVKPLQLLRSWDTNGDGVISKAEFASSIKRFDSCEMECCTWEPIPCRPKSKAVLYFQPMHLALRLLESVTYLRSENRCGKCAEHHSHPFPVCQLNSSTTIGPLLRSCSVSFSSRSSSSASGPSSVGLGWRRARTRSTGCLLLLTMTGRARSN